METKLLVDGLERTFVIVFDTGDEFPQPLLEFARKQKITSAHFEGIGAFQRVTLGWFDIETKEYKRNPLDEQVEVVSLLGNVAIHEGGPKLHAHVVIGRRDGTAHGGHLLSATVRPTLELVLTETPRHLRRKTDPATGLALIDVDAPTEPHRRGRSIAMETR